MGCFGDMTPTKQVDKTSTVSPPDWVQKAGEENYNTAKTILNKGFNPYGGELTAPLSNNEKSASDMVAKLGGTNNPYSGTAADAYTKSGAAPAFNYDFNTVVDPNSPLGSVQSYMDPYLAHVLAPALRQLSVSGAQARQGINANATAAGAYGDARHGVVEGEQLKNQQQQEVDTTAQGYSGAFNSAMSNRQQDLSRLFGTQQAQDKSNETALSRARQSGIDLTNLDQYDTGRTLSLASALGQTGANERGVNDAADKAKFNEWMRSNNFTQDQVSWLTSILAGTPVAKTTTGSETTSQPDNSGWQAVGTLATSLLSSI